MDTRRYASFLQVVGKEYNNALLVVQSNNTGQAVIRFLIQDGYQNLYYDPKTKQNQGITQKIRQLIRSDKHTPGFATTNKTRPLMIQQMARMIRQKQVIIYSIRTIQQLRTFV